MEWHRILLHTTYSSNAGTARAGAATPPRLANGMKAAEVLTAVRGAKPCWQPPIFFPSCLFRPKLSGGAPYLKRLVL